VNRDRDEESGDRRVTSGRANLIENIRKNTPGWQLQDVALLYASGTYFAGGVTLDGKLFEILL